MIVFVLDIINCFGYLWEIKLRSGLKKLVSILLLSALLFNTGGYSIVFWALRYQANMELQKQLDANDYVDGESVVIKIPITLPYQTNGADFERVNGEFEHQGEFYKLVKQKLENDTLHIVCIKDHKEKQIVTTMVNFSKQSNDLPTSAALKVLGGFLKEYKGINSLEIISNDGWSTPIPFGNPSFATISPIFPVIAPPPKSFC